MTALQPFELDVGDHRAVSTGFASERDLGVFTHEAVTPVATHQVAAAQLLESMRERQRR